MTKGNAELWRDADVRVRNGWGVINHSGDGGKDVFPVGEPLDIRDCNIEVDVTRRIWLPREGGERPLHGRRQAGLKKAGGV